MPSPSADAVASGQHLYYVVGCASCHEANGSGRRTGPTLDHIGSVAGTRRTGMGAAEYISQSILEPEAYFVPGYEGFASPSFDRPLPREDLRLSTCR
jgi:mono/diheme cytochrome c family protein